MPISKHNRPLYPDNWKEISRRIRFERAGGKCEKCGVADGAIGYRDGAGKFHEYRADMTAGELAALDAAIDDEPRTATRDPRPLKIVLTVAHVDQNPANNAESNLLALCQRCHNRLDAPHRARNAATTRANKRAKPIQFTYPARCVYCTVDLGNIAGPGFTGQPCICGVCLVGTLESQKPLLTGGAR